MALNNANGQISLADVIGHLMLNDLTLIVCLEYLVLHHALTYGRHLGTVVGVDDGGYDVAAECGTYLIEQVLIDLTCFLVLILTDLKVGAVSCKSATQGR